MEGFLNFLIFVMILLLVMPVIIHVIFYDAIEYRIIPSNNFEEQKIKKYYFNIAKDYYRYNLGDQVRKTFMRFLSKEHPWIYDLKSFVDFLNDKKFDLISELKLFKKLGGIIDNPEINNFISSDNEYDNNIEEKSEYIIPGTVRTLGEIQRQIDLNEEGFFLSICSRDCGCYNMHKEIVGFLKDLIEKKRDAKTCNLYIKETIIDYYVNIWHLCDITGCAGGNDSVLSEIAMILTLIYLLEKNVNLEAMVDLLNGVLQRGEYNKLVLLFLQEKIEEMNVNKVRLNKDSNLWWYWSGHEWEQLPKNKVLFRFKGKKYFDSTESIYDFVKKSVDSIY